MAYDIIGDIHGHADKLEALLRTLGYRDTAGAWRHPTRKAIFVGDFIERGPAQVRSVQIQQAGVLGTIGRLARRRLESTRCACLDYSAARGGPLVAYRFDSEPELSLERLVWVA
jgi:hypothetical protein